MSILDIFRSAPAAPAPAPVAPVETPTAGATLTPEAPTNPDISAMDSFSDLWKNDPTAGTSEADLDTDSLFTIDPQKIQDTVAKIDFANVLDSESLGKIAQGGEGAQQAFSESMNKVAQHVFTQSMLANAVLVKQALAGAQGQFDKRAENSYRKSQVTDAVRTSNPVFNHPSVVPMVEALESQLSRKYPTASPAEIKDKANMYFADFAKAIQAPDRKAAATSAGEMDWDKFQAG